MKKSWKKYAAWLIHPMAIGFYITIIIVRLTFTYYDVSSRAVDANQVQGISEFFYMIHQKSIDMRLRLRGPRKVASNLALLAIDERSVATIGRWPFSREVMAKGIENAFKHGAKLVAFDIIFSEPQLNPARQVYDQLKIDNQASGPIADLLTSVAAKMDSDQALASVFTNYSDKIVAGSFFNSMLHSHYPPETEFCRDLIFKRSVTGKQWDREEVLLATNDPYQPYMPKALAETFVSVLQEKDKAVRDKIGMPHIRKDEVALENSVALELYQTCDSILETFREEFNAQWKSAILAQENPKEFSFPTYDAWLQDYRAKSFRNSIHYADDWVLNYPSIAQGTKHTGYFNAEQDSDGTIRSNALLVRTGNFYFPALSLKSFLVVNGYNASPQLEVSDISRTKEIKELRVTNNETGDTVFSIPTDHMGKMMINYAGPDQMYPYLSFADLVSDSPDAEISQRVWEPSTKIWEKRVFKVKKADFIKDKIFVAGATAMGIYDLRVTPFQENFPGPETHLNALENMFQRNFLHTVPNEPINMIMLLAGLGLILSIALSYLGALWGIVLTAAGLVGVATYDRFFLFNQGIVVSIVWPIFLIMFLYVALTFYRYLTEERGKKELRQTFQKYVSPAIVEEILAHPDNIQLGGRKVKLTVFFSDVRGFTTISEKLDPTALSDLLNSYLTPMTEIVFKNRGTLDKYMGDAVMAFFGAPIGYDDHAKWGCRCALQSLEKLYELQQEYAKKGLPTIDIGIGLNTGEVNVGNMGSQTVRSYTVMGDAVNLASRLEGINKTYGTRIILSEFTHNEVKDSFLCREVDWVRVKGKAQPVKIFELISENTGKNPPGEYIQHFQTGYDHYHAQAWQAGLDAFAKALDLNPKDEVAKLYIERCQEYLVEPPEEGWDGVFVMKTK